MAKTSIGQIATTQTFQNWLDKTNEMVDLFETDAMTASSQGDTTTGDATLVGDFTATNLAATAALSTDSIGKNSAGVDYVDVTDPMVISGKVDGYTLQLSHSAPRIGFNNGSILWTAGSDGNDFVVDYNDGDAELRITTAGLVTVGDLTVTGTLTAGTLLGGGGPADTSELPEDPAATYDSGTQYFTRARAQAAFSAGTNITFGAAVNDVIPIEMTVDFLRSDQDDTYTGNLTVVGDIDQTGTLTVTGDIQCTGDVISAYSASDIRLKENLERIPDAISKVNKINGYTFNYTKAPNIRSAGVVAQELEKVLPEVVFDIVKEDDSYKAVRYDQIVPLLIEAIKELNEKVETLSNTKCTCSCGG